jgi:hypothetical protein
MGCHFMNENDNDTISRVKDVLAQEMRHRDHSSVQTEQIGKAIGSPGILAEKNEHH